jgi:hypothetical protein
MTQPALAGQWQPADPTHYAALSFLDRYRGDTLRAYGRHPPAGAVGRAAPDRAAPAGVRRAPHYRPARRPRLARPPWWRCSA